MVRESHATPRSVSDASAQLGDVAYLTVTAVNSTGAFLRWGAAQRRAAALQRTAFFALTLASGCW